jgi:hypothetical protein
MEELSDEALRRIVALQKENQELSAKISKIVAINSYVMQVYGKSIPKEDFQKIDRLISETLTESKI